jgi:hypothetical protein
MFRSVNGFFHIGILYCLYYIFPTAKIRFFSIDDYSGLQNGKQNMPLACVAGACAARLYSGSLSGFLRKWFNIIVVSIPQLLTTNY